jgi:lambda family phage portal protein
MAHPATTQNAATRPSTILTAEGVPATVQTRIGSGKGFRGKWRADAGWVPDGMPLTDGGRLIPYQAADPISQDMGAWFPQTHSPDYEINPWRKRVMSRSHDIARNDGWASGGLSRICDSTIGGELRLMAKPDYRALGLDAVWAGEFAAVVEAKWRLFAEDMVGKYCDIARRMTFGQISALAFRHKMIDNTAVAVMHWLPERVGPGAARYATAIELIHPDRLCNPWEQMDTLHRRGGVEIDDYGAAIGYHFRHGFTNEWFDPQQAVWDYVPRETSWGRPMVVHHYDSDVAGQNGGGIGIFGPILAKLKMLNKYDQVELQAAVLNAVFSAYIESPFDHSLMTDALSSGEIGPYQESRSHYHDKHRLAVGGVRMPVLFPGEKIGVVNAARPATSFEPFEAACLRNIASAMGTSYEQLSQDWSKTNYSSARAALMESWKTLWKRRTDFAQGFCTPIYATWLEEEIENGDLPMPSKAPEFIAFRSAYAKARWIGPPRGWVDPVKERQGAILGMEANLSTLEDEAAEQGRDWRDILDQKQIEQAEFIRRGIPLPNAEKLTAQYADQPETEAGGKPK